MTVGPPPRARRSTRSLLVAAGFAAVVVPQAAAAPLRTPSPGTGVYRGFALQGHFEVGEERGDDGHELTDATASVEVRYTPATSWSFGVIVPRIERTATAPSGAEVRASGLGDVTLDGKYRFFRRLGRWRDRQAALGFGVELPTGESEGLALPGALPLPLDRSLRPGSGSTDLFGSLSYQQARGRFVQAASLGYRRNGEGEGYRFGDELRLDLDAEAIVLPVRYTTPGRELFALLETSLVRRDADALHGRAVPGTRRTELLLAPGLTYVATERLALGVSVAVPVLTRTDEGGMASRRHVLVEARFAF